MYDDTKPNHYFINVMIIRTSSSMKRVIFIESRIHPTSYPPSRVQRYTHIKSIMLHPVHHLYNYSVDNSQLKNKCHIRAILFRLFIIEITSVELATYDHHLRIPSPFPHQNHIVVAYKHHCFSFIDCHGSIYHRWPIHPQTWLPSNRAHSRQNPSKFTSFSLILS